MNGTLFTVESIATLTGATTIVYIISNSLQKAFNFNPKWFALILSIIISLLSVYLSSGKINAYIIGFLNGFLIYANTVGIVHIAGKDETAQVITTRNSNGFDTPLGGGAPYGTSENATTSQQRKNKRTFRTKWY
jgi:uncharacterized membrane protein